MTYNDQQWLQWDIMAYKTYKTTTYNTMPYNTMPYNTMTCNAMSYKHNDQQWTGTTVQEKVQDGDLVLTECKSEYNAADILTKVFQSLEGNFSISKWSQEEHLNWSKHTRQDFWVRGEVWKANKWPTLVLMMCLLSQIGGNLWKQSLKSWCCGLWERKFGWSTRPSSWTLKQSDGLTDHLFYSTYFSHIFSI
jgi:hypothetical protein